jgi:protein arginine kinase activator
MTDKFEEDNEEQLPERPLECSECKKPISVCYTTIIDNNMTRTSMCADCPELHRRLHRTPARSTSYPKEIASGLACGNCGTTLESLRVGIPLGCNTCYEVFSDVLIGEMLAAEKIPARLAANKKSIPIHIGRTPGESQAINPSLRLLALNEALSETLKKEDYEQAAWLRDQIKALTENPETTNEQQ